MIRSTIFVHILLIDIRSSVADYKGPAEKYFLKRLLK